MDSKTLIVGLGLVLTLPGCAAIRTQRLGAPADPYLGPASTACVEAMDYAGSAAFVRGQAQANQAIAAGNLHFVMYGMRLIEKPEPLYWRRWHSYVAQHGITLDDGPEEFPPRGEYSAFNCRMDQEIRNRFGQDFWLAADRQARL